MSLVSFLLPHLKALRPLFDLKILADIKESNILEKNDLDTQVQYIPLRREIHLVSDLITLWNLFHCFRSERPIAVHTLTPKAGLLGMAAAWLAGVELRTHTFTGQVWLTRRGLMRWILKGTDKMTAALATGVLVDSESQRTFLINEGLIRKHRSSVLGRGSICGVDTQRFSPDPIERRLVRDELGVTQDALVCLYLGRLKRDKGVLDLALAFSKVADKNCGAVLWFVGPDEDNLYHRLKRSLSNCVERVRWVGYSDRPERFMRAADLFCLPSYREGFGSTVIEAAACGVPALVSRIYGLTDAVVLGQTGWMHEVGDIEDLASKLEDLLAKPAFLAERGEAARAHVKQNFEQSIITRAMLEFYVDNLKKF